MIPPSHHPLIPSILYDSVNSTHKGRQATLSTMVVCCLFMYNPLGCILYSHPPPALRFAVIPVICCAALWWNSIRALSISPVTTQILLPFSNTDWSTALYISPWSRTVSPVGNNVYSVVWNQLSFSALRITLSKINYFPILYFFFLPGQITSLSIVIRNLAPFSSCSSLFS